MGNPHHGAALRALCGHAARLRVPIIIAAAVGDGWTLACVTLGIILVTETLVGHVLEPLFFGKSTGLPPVAVVAAAAFWTAIWGPVGLVLSTPITIVLLVVGRWSCALRSSCSPPTTPSTSACSPMIRSRRPRIPKLRGARHDPTISGRGGHPRPAVAQHRQGPQGAEPEREVSVNAYAGIVRGSVARKPRGWGCCRAARSPRVRRGGRFRVLFGLGAAASQEVRAAAPPPTPCSRDLFGRSRRGRRHRVCVLSQGAVCRRMSLSRKADR